MKKDEEEEDPDKRSFEFNEQLIIDALDLEDISTEDIDTDAPLFVEGLGLDSIDALELGIALQKKYALTLSADAESNRQHFASVAALTRFVTASRA